MNKLRSMVTILLERARNIMKQSTNKKKTGEGISSWRYGIC
jgi:hypothetical protein